eukprot:95635-Hanusia_phi.AAC.1
MAERLRAEPMQEAAKISGVKRVLKASAPHLERRLAEELEALILQTHNANKYTHILAASSACTKSVLPRVAAKLDVNQISEVIAIESEVTLTCCAGLSSLVSRTPLFVQSMQEMPLPLCRFQRHFRSRELRLRCVQSSDTVKVMTTRATSFDKAEVSSTLVGLWESLIALWWQMSGSASIEEISSAAVGTVGRSLWKLVDWRAVGRTHRMEVRGAQQVGQT